MMLGAALRADRVSRAESGSPKTMADAQFAPAICACTERLRTIESRSVASSYATNADDAISSVRPLTRRFIQVSFLRMEYWPIFIVPATSSRCAQLSEVPNSTRGRRDRLTRD